MISIELLHYTPKEVLLTAISQPYKKESSDLNLANKIINVLKHESVAEHVQMNFLIKGVSRLELQEHMRHRISSTTCESTRYTLQHLYEKISETKDWRKVNVFDYFNFPEYREEDWSEFKNPASEYENFIGELSHIYQEFCFYLYAWKERKIKNDVIKYALPEGYPTQFVWSINLRSLKNFLNLRDSKSAHQEIAHVAKLIKESLKDTYIFELI